MAHLAYGRLAALQHSGDLLEREAEDLLEYEDRPLQRRESLEDDEQGERDRLGQLHLLARVGLGDQRFGQPGADVLLAGGGGGREPVEREVGDRTGQIAHRVVHRGGHLTAAQPGVLHHVLGVGDAAEHAVGDAEQHPPVAFEGGRVDHVRDGTSQASEKPWLVRPKALLMRDR
ncbi:hypothetical protein SSPO_035370 [Streptomyces antimycoticus]|uniref:Uncharacterized protein n=1 Tax=Streptomyces antimycoticus TaxID=68175 RepID=A0A499UVK0_9ACTN|nr:hypothetical protein SSPO_035370 [Streptomyces antimycoticus]